jgi:hypothetical protein
MCKRGVDVAVVDAVVGNLSGSWCPEYCYKFSAGATQIAGAIHTWGGEKGCWFPKGAGPSWGGPLYCEQGPVSLAIESSGNDLGPIYAHSATKVCIAVVGTDNTLHQVRVDAKGWEPVGIEIADQYNSVSDARIKVPAGKKGINVTWAGGMRLRLRDVYVSGGGGESALIDCSGAEQGLQAATIDVYLRGSGSGTGLKLRDASGKSRLGAHNTINIATPPDVANGGLTKIIDLPDGWQSTTPRRTTNVITVNGVRWYPPRDE